jgi:hypothetical protein
MAELGKLLLMLFAGLVILFGLGRLVWRGGLDDAQPPPVPENTVCSLAPPSPRMSVLQGGEPESWENWTNTAVPIPIPALVGAGIIYLFAAGFAP